MVDDNLFLHPWTIIHDINAVLGVGIVETEDFRICIVSIFDNFENRTLQLRYVLPANQPGGIGIHVEFQNFLIGSHNAFPCPLYVG